MEEFKNIRGGVLMNKDVKVTFVKLKECSQIILDILSDYNRSADDILVYMESRGKIIEELEHMKLEPEEFKKFYDNLEIQKITDEIYALIYERQNDIKVAMKTKFNQTVPSNQV